MAKLAAATQIAFLKALVQLTSTVTRAQETAEKHSGPEEFGCDRAYFAGRYAGLSFVWSLVNKMAVVESLTRAAAHDALTQAYLDMARAFKNLDAQSDAGYVNGEYDLDGMRDLFPTLHSNTWAREYLEGRQSGIAHAVRQLLDYGNVVI